MKKTLTLTFVLISIFVIGSNGISAQITINIPKIPKIKKPKIKQPTTTTATTTGDSAFDKQAFTDIKWGNTEYLNPYLECYAKKHNLELIKVTGDAFSPRSFANAVEMEQTLQAELPKLAEIESLLKSKLKTRPDTALNYHENPAIWEEITSNRDQYLQCAVGTKDSLRASESVWLSAHLDSIKKMQKEVDEYDPETKLYLVSATNYDYLLFSVSPRARAKWIKDADAMEFSPNLDPALDALAASAAKKLPIYTPGAQNFAFRNAAEEKMMKATLKNAATLEILKIGLFHGNWQISKDDYGLPNARYKQGYIWVRNTADDHPYCHLYQVNIIQDYAGGGTYAASYARFLNDSLFGCPAK